MQQEIANFQAKTAPLWERLSIYEYRERGIYVGGL